jgi:DNA-binding protein YbaB
MTLETRPVRWHRRISLAPVRRMVDGHCRLAGFEERAVQARSLSERLTRLTATARSDDGLVEVSVASSGTVTGLNLDERIRSQSAEKTAGQILNVMREAQAMLTRLAVEATADTVGLGSETGRAVVDSFAKRLAGAGDGEADAGR